VSCLSQDECYNYIKVLVPRNDETLFACGTNAFNPTCRNYKVWWVYFCHTHILAHCKHLLQMHRFLKLPFKESKLTCLHAHVYLNLSALKLIWILGLFKNVYTLLLIRNEFISCHTCLQPEFAVREFCIFSHQTWLLVKLSIFLQLQWAMFTHVSQTLTGFMCILG